MEHPKMLNSAMFIKIDDNPLIGSDYLCPISIEYKFCRTIIDLKLKDCSYTEIRDSIVQVHGNRISKKDISDVIIAAGARAKFLNGVYDHLVDNKFRIIEIDEIYQGRNNCLLGVVDKETTYLLNLSPLPTRENASFLRILAPQLEQLEHLDLVITDGLHGYPGVIAEIDSRLAHLECHVHAGRRIYKIQSETKRAAKKVQNALQEIQIAWIDLIKKITQKREDLRSKKRQLNRWIAKRSEYYRNHDIKPYSKKSSWNPERIRICETINALRVEVRSKTQTITNFLAKKAPLKAEIRQKTQKFREKQQANLQAGRLVKRFLTVISTLSSEYEVVRHRFEEILANSKSEIAPKIAKYMSDHPHLFTLQERRITEWLLPNYANTNTVESIFSRLRNFLKKAKQLHDTPERDALLELLRFHHNFTPPHTGQHRHESPLQRLGVRSQYKIYIDALFPPKWHEMEPVEGWNKKDLKTVLIAHTSG